MRSSFGQEHDEINVGSTALRATASAWCRSSHLHAKRHAHQGRRSFVRREPKGSGRTAHSVDLRGGCGDRRRPVVEHGKLGAVGRKVVVCTPRRRIRTKPSTHVVLLGWCYSLTATCPARPLLTKISVIGRSTSTRMSMVSPVSTLIVAFAWPPPAQSSKARNQSPSRRGNHGKNGSAHRD